MRKAAATGWKRGSGKKFKKCCLPTL
ncbi:MAG: SEC-C domain-containing protein [Xanthobacteraceae bacterium]|nr:SEC-C domain-containing protein [Xanthobacteraceae bacterium]